MRLPWPGTTAGISSPTDYLPERERLCDLAVVLSKGPDAPVSLAGGGDWDDSVFLAIRGFAAAEAEVFFFEAAGILTRIEETIRNNEKETKKKEKDRTKIKIRREKADL